MEQGGGQRLTEQPSIPHRARNLVAPEPQPDTPVVFNARLTCSQSGPVFGESQYVYRPEGVFTARVMTVTPRSFLVLLCNPSPRFVLGFLRPSTLECLRSDWFCVILLIFNVKHWS